MPAPHRPIRREPSRDPGRRRCAPRACRRVPRHAGPGRTGRRRLRCRDGSRADARGRRGADPRHRCRPRPEHLVCRRRHGTVEHVRSSVLPRGRGASQANPLRLSAARTARSRTWEPRHISRTRRRCHQSAAPAHTRRLRRRARQGGPRGVPETTTATVLVDHLGADPLDQVGLREREPHDQAVFLGESGAQRGQLASATHGLERHGRARSAPTTPAARRSRALRARAARADDPRCGHVLGGESVIDPLPRVLEPRPFRGLVEQQHQLGGTRRVGAVLERLVQRLEVRGGTMWSAKPAYTASAASIVPPVRARYSPRRPGARPNSHDPPTSGVKPMRVSGMASFERSVTMRMAA